MISKINLFQYDGKWKVWGKKEQLIIEGIPPHLSDMKEAEVMQQDNDPEHAAKATRVFYRPKQWNVVDWLSQSPDFSQLEHVFLLLKIRPKVKSETSNASNDGCS